MNYLLDTHVLLWWLSDAPQLSNSARSLIADPANLFFISAVSIWEIRIKQQVGKLELPSNFHSNLAAQSFEQLPITHDHVHAIIKLPLIHRDPFDRLLIAQAKIESLILVTHDRLLEQYNIEAVYV